MSVLQCPSRPYGYECFQVRFRNFDIIGKFDNWEIQLVYSLYRWCSLFQQIQLYNTYFNHYHDVLCYRGKWRMRKFKSGRYCNNQFGSLRSKRNAGLQVRYGYGYPVGKWFSIEL